MGVIDLVLMRRMIGQVSADLSMFDFLGFEFLSQYHNLWTAILIEAK